MSWGGLQLDGDFHMLPCRCIPKCKQEPPVTHGKCCCARACLPCSIQKHHIQGASQQHAFSNPACDHTKQAGTKCLPVVLSLMVLLNVTVCIIVTNASSAVRLAALWAQQGLELKHYFGCRSRMRPWKAARWVTRPRRQAGPSPVVCGERALSPQAQSLQPPLPLRP